MLTVLIREPTGHERILEAVEVASQPPSEFSPGDRTYFIYRGEQVERIDKTCASSLYVMNERGSTVASYHFQSEPKPPPVEPPPVGVVGKADPYANAVRVG